MTHKIPPREFWHLAAIEATLSAVSTGLIAYGYGRGDYSWHSVLAVGGLSLGLTALAVGNAMWETHKAKRPVPGNKAPDDSSKLQF